MEPAATAGPERTEWYGKGLFGSASRNEMASFQNDKNRNRLLIPIRNNGLRNFVAPPWSQNGLSARLVR
ncbi:hypothetical protein A8E81_13270 [Burkholderia cenocepacia]|nr:hypothetical protein A8E75_33100 [Burkholderia cenocepacia]ONV26193.1 hypothetical protein A8E78_25065 [Burkholderia cenocepacia]ONV27521.1 hypothetical protein A8E74_06300 [Burkholderia cenocepacia]ONV38140.1 hypothetical protein A8E77_06775 [Burkholderia cenocepacia]ONV39640.1 hypothetical protein A8E82_21170 [Burkholderia cenocepacia]